MRKVVSLGFGRDRMRRNSEALVDVEFGAERALVEFHLGADRRGALVATERRPALSSSKKYWRISGRTFPNRKRMYARRSGNCAGSNGAFAEIVDAEREEATPDPAENSNRSSKIPIERWMERRPARQSPCQVSEGMFRNAIRSRSFDQANPHVGRVRIGIVGGFRVVHPDAIVVRRFQHVDEARAERSRRRPDRSSAPARSALRRLVVPSTLTRMASAWRRERLRPCRTRGCSVDLA